MNCKVCSIHVVGKKTGLCRKHYIEQSTYIGAKGANAHNWKGKVSHNGYFMLRKPDHPFAKGNGYVFEHRLVIEKKLNRYLLPTEVVHHINGIKTDNRIENLQLMNSNSEHVRGNNHPWKSKKCNICECKHIAKGYCETHYWYYILKPSRNKKYPKKYTFITKTKIICKCN